MEAFLAGYLVVIILSSIGTGIVFAALCYSLAARKGHASPATFGWLGFFFGMFTMLHVIGMPDYVVREQLEGMRNPEPSSNVRPARASSKRSTDDDELPPL